jgi:hypothetical protein
VPARFNTAPRNETATDSLTCARQGIRLFADSLIFKDVPMPIPILIIAALVTLFGLRLAGVALQTAVSGKVMTRRGLRSQWQPAPTRQAALKIAFRDALMGILLIALGVFLVT